MFLKYITMIIIIFVLVFNIAEVNGDIDKVNILINDNIFSQFLDDFPAGRWFKNFFNFLHIG